MKGIKTLSALAALFILMPAFTSCDKDDDDEPKQEDQVNAGKIAGVYSGSLGYNVMGFEPGDIAGTYDLKITQDATDKDDVVVELPACTFTPPIPNASAFTIPALTVDGVDVTVKGDEYTLSEDDFSIDVEGTVYTGKLTGTVKGNDANLQYTVRPGRMPMDINFTFTGTLK